MNLQERITKKQQQIEKLEKAYIKYATDAEEKAIMDRFLETGDRTEYYAYLKSYNCYYGSDAWRKALDLYDARVTLNKYFNALKVEEARNNTVKIDAIWNFLLEYKSKVREYLEDNKQWKHEYYRLNKLYCDMYNSRKYSVDELREVSQKEREARNNMHPYVDKYYSTRSGWDEPELDKQLIKDIENKYYKLINQVTEITGEIIDASHLSVHAGELNGIIIGKNGKACVSTIGAGGYNIQCFHYRTLVKEVK